MSVHHSIIDSLRSLSPRVRQFVNPRELFILFTNGNKPGHRQDLLNSICFPKGAVLSFAYETDHFAGGIKPKKGDLVLIVYFDPIVKLDDGKEINAVEDVADRKKIFANHSGFDFFPLRFGKLTSSPQRESESHTFSIELASLFESSDYLSAGRELIERISEDWLEGVPHPTLSADPEETQLVFQDKDYLKGGIAQAHHGRKSSRQDASIWHQLTAEINQRSTSLEKTVLLCLFSVRAKTRWLFFTIRGQAPSAPVPTKKVNSARDTLQLSLIPGKIYEFTAMVARHSGSENVSKSIQFSSFGDSILTVSPPIIKQRGPSEDVVWNLILSESAALQSGSLTLEVEGTGMRQPAAGMSSRSIDEEIVAPRLVILWKARPRILEFLCLAASIASGLTLVSDPTAVLQLLVSDEAAKETICVLLVRALGFVATAGGGVFLLRRGVTKIMGV